MIYSTLDILHNPIFLSNPNANHSPFGENAPLETQSEWPVRVLISSPLDTLHISIVQSENPDTKYSPFGENTKFETGEN